jgi:hypothetical protein
MIDARFVPIDKWPGEKRPSYKRINSPFGVKYQRLLDDLERELNHLHAKDIIIQAYLRREQIRNDGWPRSSERPSEPGIVLSFLKGGKDEISFPCDTYRTWESNLRAISLTLTALRSIDRYGVTEHAEQYKGWAKLPPAPEKMSPTDALAFIRIHTGIEATTAEKLREAYRSAARKLHPDISGTDQQFLMLSKAKDAIEEAYGWGKTA